MVGYSTSEFRSIYVKKTVYLVKKKLKKRLHPPDTYYDLLHINFEILGTQRQAARTAKGLIVSILSLSVSIHRGIIYNGEYKLS